MIYRDISYLNSRAQAVYVNTSRSQQVFFRRKYSQTLAKAYALEHTVGCMPPAPLNANSSAAKDS